MNNEENLVAEKSDAKTLMKVETRCKSAMYQVQVQDEWKMHTKETR